MESWQTQPLLWLKIGSNTELQVVADGTQNFESDCFIADKLIARAGETMDVDTTNTSPKISNLFFIFLSPFVFCYLKVFVIFNLHLPVSFRIYFGIFFLYLVSLQRILKQVQDDGLRVKFFPWEIKTKFTK